jgi:uncharacterized protein (DUF1330 family)
MPAYMIVQIKVTREEGWPEYREQVSKLFAAHGGRYLVRGGPVEVLEGCTTVAASWSSSSRRWR